MSSRHIQNVSETYSKDGYLSMDLPRSHFWEIYGWCTRFSRVTKVSQILVSHFTTPFSGCLQAYLEPSQTSQWSFFAKILNSFKPLTIFDCNHFHNILRIFDILPNSPFTGSETMRDYYIWTWYLRVASRLAEQLKT